MVLPRPALFRTALSPRLARPARLLRNADRRWQRIAESNTRRSYANGASGTAGKASGDMPWLIGATAVTIPAVWFILQPSKEHAHHAGAPQARQGDGGQRSDEKPTSQAAAGEHPAEDAPQAVPGVEEQAQGGSPPLPAAGSTEKPGDETTAAESTADGGDGPTHGKQQGASSDVSSGPDQDEGAPEPATAPPDGDPARPAAASSSSSPQTSAH